MTKGNTLFTLFLASSFLIGAEAVARTTAQPLETDLGRMTLRLKGGPISNPSADPKAQIEQEQKKVSAKKTAKEEKKATKNSKKAKKKHEDKRKKTKKSKSQKKLEKEFKKQQKRALRLKKKEEEKLRKEKKGLNKKLKKLEKQAKKQGRHTVKSFTHKHHIKETPKRKTIDSRKAHSSKKHSKMRKVKPAEAPVRTSQRSTPSQASSHEFVFKMSEFMNNLKPSSQTLLKELLTESGLSKGKQRKLMSFEQKFNRHDAEEALSELLDDLEDLIGDSSSLPQIDQRHESLLEDAENVLHKLYGVQVQ